MTDASGMPSVEACTQWCGRVHQAQSARMTPEQREALSQRVEASRQYEQNMRRCNAYRCHAERSSALATEGLRQLSVCQAPAEFSGAHMRWQNAQAASEGRQAQMLGMLGGVGSGSAQVLRSAQEERTEGLAEAVAFVGAGNVAAVAADAEQTGSGGCGSVHTLLQQLKTEPAAAEECTIKFQLYEGYAAQVEKMRISLFGFYEESLPSVPPAVAAEMTKQVRAIDSAEAMGIPDHVREWFVYHMMKQASQNNIAMATALHNFEKKLELLANLTESDCPVCLEPFTEEGPHVAETLGCCHKICHECWVHWTRVMDGSPFCPLCRNDAFLGAVAVRAVRADPAADGVYH